MNSIQKAFGTIVPGSFWATSGVYSSTFTYTGIASTTINGVATKGEWMQLSTSFAIELMEFSISLPKHSTTRAPTAFQVVGSNDTLTWTNLITISSTFETRYSATVDYTLNYVIPIAAASYKNFRVVFTNSILGTGTSIAVNNVAFKGLDGTTISFLYSFHILFSQYFHGYLHCHE
jgi:hypothetical protein